MKKHLPVTRARQSQIIEVPLALEAPAITAEEATAALQEMGMVELSTNALKNLELLGKYVKGAGTLKLANGQILASQQVLSRVSLVLLAQIERETKKQKPSNAQLVALSRSLGYLQTKVGDLCNRLIQSQWASNTGGGPIDDGQGIDTKYVPGSKVEPGPGTTLVKAEAGSTIHLHAEGNGQSKA